MEQMLTVRAMTKKDIAGVHRIETLSFRTPWSKWSLLGELKNDVAHYVVAEQDGKLIGYCGMWVLFEEAHITNIAIDPAFRGNGYGKQLLIGAMQVARHFGAEAMTLEVRETNHTAQSLYRKFDFEQQGRRRKYYTDTGEDALLLWNRKILCAIENNPCICEAIAIQWGTFESKGEGL